MATTIPCHYQDPASEQTLREGYAEYVHANPELLDPDALGKAGRFFRAHDYGHVLFGCDTSVIHEALMDTWTIFGTTAGWREPPTTTRTRSSARSSTTSSARSGS